MRKKRILILTALVLLLCCAFSATAFAAGTGDVAGAVESTWQTASGQIKTVVNNVVFPAIDLILRCFSSPNSAQLILTTERAASLSGRLPPFCSRAWCSL